MGVVVEVLMALELLLLSELLITLVTFERSLVCVNKQVVFETILRHRGELTQVALEALLTLVRLLVYLRERYGKGLINLFFLSTITDYALRSCSI